MDKKLYRGKRDFPVWRRHNLFMPPQPIPKSSMKPVSEDGCFPFFFEKSPASNSQENLAPTVSVQPVTRLLNDAIDKAEFLKPAGQKKVAKTGSKNEAEQQKKRRRLKAEKGMVRVESYVSREIGARLRQRAKITGLTQGEIIHAALAKVVSAK